MKSNIPVLYPNVEVGTKVTNYSEEHSLQLPKHILDYHDRVDKTNERSNLMISNSQAQNHIWLARLIGAKRVLEIGVFVGYSSMVWSFAVGSEGRVTGLEFEAEFAKLAEAAFEANGIENCEIVVGDAVETMTKLNPQEPYDLIFIDAQKSGYPAYLANILAHSKPGGPNRLLRPGGLIIADNVLRRGIVADPSDANPHVKKDPLGTAAFARHDDIEKLKIFNRAMNEDPRLEAWLMPLYDGVAMARLKD